MPASKGRKPLITGLAVIRIEDFCEMSGLDRRTVEDLMRQGHFGGGLWDEERTRAKGMLEDLVPSREELVALGLRVREDYRPRRG